MEKRKFVSVDEAINLLPEGDEIHTFYNCGNSLIGADWDRQGVIDKLNASDKIELTGMQARSIGHGLAVYNNDTKWQSEVLFIETDKDKLDAFDPLVIEDGMPIDEAISHLDTYSSTMGSGQTTQEQHEESKRVAIDTMRKYQKIKDIYYHQSGEALENSLRAVIEDGNVD